VEPALSLPFYVQVDRVIPAELHVETCKFCDCGGDRIVTAVNIYAYRFLQYFKIA
jgi:hypothetical protein